VCINCRRALVSRPHKDAFFLGTGDLRNFETREAKQGQVGQGRKCRSRSREGRVEIRGRGEDRG